MSENPTKATNQTKVDYDELTNQFCKSNYFIAAIGCRNVDFDELKSILKIIAKTDTCLVGEALNNLFKYHPDTIAMDLANRKYNCERFNPSVCDCFFPDIKFEDCYCQRKKKERLEETDYRGSVEYTFWRTSVFKRDNYTCQDCGQVGGELNAHHKKKFKDFPKHRYDIINGITLCVECHKKIHKIKA